MLDDQVVGVQALVLSVALRVLQELEQELCGLEGPPALGGSVNLGVEDVSYCALNISSENIMQISILSVRPS